MHLRSTHAHSLVRRENLQFILAANRPRHQSPRYHRSETLHGEYAVDRKARQRVRIPRWSHCGRRNHSAL